MNKIQSSFKKIRSLIFKNRKRVNLSEKEKTILRVIGYYFKKNTYMLGITSIEVKNDVIYLTLNNPGVLIGKKGKDISEVKKLINESLNQKMKLRLIETDINRILNTFKL